MYGLDPSDKKVRVYNLHKNLEKSVCEIIGAMGVKDTDDLYWHLMQDQRYRDQALRRIYEYLEPGKSVMTQVLQNLCSGSCLCTVLLFDSVRHRI